MIGFLAGRSLVSTLIEALRLSAYAITPSLIPNAGLGGALNLVCDFSTGEIHAPCIPFYIIYLITIIFELTGAIFLLMILLGGYQYVIGKATGGGGEEGKARVRFAIIGFIFTALSVYILDFVLDALI